MTPDDISAWRRRAELAQQLKVVLPRAAHRPDDGRITCGEDREEAAQAAPRPEQIHDVRIGQPADVGEFRAAVYACPGYAATLATSTPIADYVPVDFELRGRPIDKGQPGPVKTSRPVVAAWVSVQRPAV